MSDDAAYELNMKKLEKLLKALKGKLPTARVGILDDGHASRTDGELTNVQIGAFHEFGTSVHPVRSFLRVPISDNLERVMEESGATSKEAIAEVIAAGSVRPWVEKIAVLAEGIVLEAFDTGGYGKWPPSNMAHKTNKQTLVESQQLRNSISSKVTG